MLLQILEQLSIDTGTTVDAATAQVDNINERQSQIRKELAAKCSVAEEKTKAEVTKMQGCMETVVETNTRATDAMVSPGI